MSEKEECCGTCIWHRYETIDKDWVCTNGCSDRVADWTEYSDCHEEWEER